MPDKYSTGKTNKVRQLRDKANYERETVHRILDCGLVAHVAFIQDGNPVVVPMIHARDGETLYLHGARKARVIRMLEQSERISVNVTLVDGLVLARSAFNSSMNYRSVTVFGVPRFLDDDQDKLHAMKCISEHLMPGRWDELRAPFDKEVKMTGVIAMQIADASAKISQGLPVDEEEDYAIPVWAGTLPLESKFGELISDDQLLPGASASQTVRALQHRKI